MIAADAVGSAVLAALTTALLMMFLVRNPTVGDAIGTFLFSWCLLGILVLVVVVYYGDQPGPGRLRRVAHCIDVHEHSVTLRAPDGAVQGDMAAATLRVVRANIPLSRGALHGAVRIDHAHGSLLLGPIHGIGAWPGISVSPHPLPTYRIDNAWFDRLLARAS